MSISPILAQPPTNSAVEQKMNDFTAKMNDRATKLASAKKQITHLRVFSEKLAVGYQLSIDMVLKLNGILGQYSKFFDSLSRMLEQLDKNFITPEDIAIIKKITDETLTKSMGEFGAQIKSMRELYEKNNVDPKQIDVLTEAQAQMVNAGQTFVKSAGQNGGECDNSSFVNSKGKFVVEKFKRDFLRIFKAKRRPQLKIWIKNK
jgi:hypothetical protein